SAIGFSPRLTRREASLPYPARPCLTSSPRPQPCMRWQRWIGVCRVRFTSAASTSSIHFGTPAAASMVIGPTIISTPNTLSTASWLSGILVYLSLEQRRLIALFQLQKLLLDDFDIF